MIEIVEGDITTFAVDAIVNTANTGLAVVVASMARSIAPRDRS